MSQAFFITGLPRSKTAWMAEVCTTENSLCWHEPSKSMKDWRDVYALWGGPKMYYGVSDSLLGFHVEEILHTQMPKILVIERPVEEVETSLINMGYPPVPGYCRSLKERLEKVRGHPNVLFTSFSDLGGIHTLEKCIEHLMPHLRIPRGALLKFIATNIQVGAAEIQKYLPAKNLEGVFGADVLQEIFNAENVPPGGTKS